MSDVTVQYKNSVIAELDSANISKTLKTSGKYCEDDILVNYTPPASPYDNIRAYDLTIATSSDWVYLIDLPSDIASHINDDTFTVILAIKDAYAYEWYSGCLYIAKTSPVGYSGEYPVYGISNRVAGETTHSVNLIYYPANYTETSVSLGGLGVFRVADGKYYIKPSDGFIRSGNYKLIFLW